MKAIIRADSSSSIGIGHIMRDLVLASQFDDVTFVTRDLPGNINFKIEEFGYDIEIVEDNSLEKFESLIKKISPNLIVIDNYGIDYEFEKKLKQNHPNIQLMVLDDYYENHCCDILLNHNISADESKYKDLVPEDCELRCGVKHTLLRQEFYDYKVRPKLKNKSPTVFVAMGGADHSNINIRILEVVEEIGDLQVNLVTTTANKNLEQLKEYCKDKNWIDLHINSSEIARLMYESDFAIVTPSVTVNEVIFMGVPFIAIKTADNQNDIFEYLAKNHNNVIDRFDRVLLMQKIEEYKHDGLAGYELQNFINLSQDDSLKVLSWRNDLSIRKNMYNVEEITVTDHLRFIKNLSKCKDKKYFVVRKHDQDIGVIDFTQILPNDSLYMGLYAKPGVKGAGKILMDAIIQYSFRVLCVKKIYAEVFEANDRAYNLYLKHGFERISSREINDKKVICMVLDNENR